MAPISWSAPVASERARRFEDRRRAHAEHDGQEVVGECELRPAYSIRRHRKPACTTLDNGVFGVAYRELLRAEQYCAHVVAHVSREGGARLHALVEAFDAHPSDASANLAERGA